MKRLECPEMEQYQNMLHPAVWEQEDCRQHFHNTDCLKDTEGWLKDTEDTTSKDTV